MTKTLIAIPVYNARSHIKRTIESCLNQSVKTKILIIDNCSEDGTHQIAKEYADKNSNIEFVRNKKNIGRVANWNKALDIFKRSNCEYIKYVFSGDEIFANCIEELESVFNRNKEIGAIAFPYEFINKKNKANLSRHAEFANRLFTAKEATIINIAYGGILGAIICNAYSKKAIGENYFDPQLISKVDFDIKTLENCKTYYLDKTLARFNQASRGTFDDADSSHVYLEFSYLESKEFRRIIKRGMFNEREAAKLRQELITNLLRRQLKFMTLKTILKTMIILLTKGISDNVLYSIKKAIKHMINKDAENVSKITQTQIK